MTLKLKNLLPLKADKKVRKNLTAFVFTVHCNQYYVFKISVASSRIFQRCLNQVNVETTDTFVTVHKLTTGLNIKCDTYKCYVI